MDALQAPDIDLINPPYCDMIINSTLILFTLFATSAGWNRHVESTARGQNFCQLPLLQAGTLSQMRLDGARGTCATHFQRPDLPGTVALPRSGRASPGRSWRSWGARCPGCTGRTSIASCVRGGEVALGSDDRYASIHSWGDVTAQPAGEVRPIEARADGFRVIKPCSGTKRRLRATYAFFFFQSSETLF